MKKLLLLLIAMISISMVSCKDDENGKLNPDAKIWIKGVDHKGNKTLSLDNSEQLSVHELLVRDSLYLWSSNGSGESFCFADNRIDTIRDRVSIRAGAINGIDDNIYLNDTMMVMVDFHQGKHFLDTIGYIPAEQVNAMREKLIPLFNAEQWDEVYKVFEDGLQFLPCTADEFKYVHGIE